MSEMPEISFWNGNHPLQAVADRLRKMIPDEGQVDNVHRNPALERYRIAMNCYYDLYNNGLCNRAKSFARVFQCRPSDHLRMNFALGFREYADSLYALAEVRMDEIVRAAAQEQMPFLDLPSSTVDSAAAVL